MDGGNAGFARLQDVGGRVESGTETEEQKSVNDVRGKKIKLEKERRDFFLLQGAAQGREGAYTKYVTDLSEHATQQKEKRSSSTSGRRLLFWCRFLSLSAPPPTSPHDATLPLRYHAQSQPSPRQYWRVSPAPPTAQ